jgi:hypothetical protein
LILSKGKLQRNETVRQQVERNDFQVQEMTNTTAIIVTK